MTTQRIFITAFLILGLACSAGSHSESGTASQGKGDKFSGPDASLCVAVRGNGQWIFAHFGGLANIIESYGLVGAAAGGSSGTVTMFLLESIQKNPLVHQCGDKACEGNERAARAALLVKSIIGYVEVLGETEEALSFKRIAPLVAKVQSQGMQALALSDIIAARDALVTLLTSEDVVDLINPEVLTLLRNSPNPTFHVKDIIESLSNFGGFTADNQRIFTRPGVLSFDALAPKLGRAGSFYAGYEPVDPSEMESFLNDCAIPGVGMNWWEVSQLPSGEMNCGARLHGLVGAFRNSFRDGTHRNRSDEMIGASMPALVATSVITGPAVSAFQAAQARYMNAEDDSFEVDFADVRFGYFGQSRHLNAVAQNPRGYTDLKTQKFMSLGQATWAKALSLSPAEPGIAPIKPVSEGVMSAGGWPDLEPTLVLRNLGCERVVYMTRSSPGSPFAAGVARLLGMGAADEAALYSLEGESSYRLSLKEADGRLCRDFNATTGSLDIFGLFTSAYVAPIETSDSYLSQPPYAPIEASTNLGLPGCTP